jgi:hypothetical protein
MKGFFNLFWLYFCRCLFFPLFAYCTDLHYSFVSTIVNTWMCVTVLGLNMLGLPMIKTWLTQSEPKNRRYLCSIRHFRWSWPVKMFVSECVRVIVCEKKEREIVIVWERETERQREMERERVILCERERERERESSACCSTYSDLSTACIIQLDWLAGLCVEGSLAVSQGRKPSALVHHL